LAQKCSNTTSDSALFPSPFFISHNDPVIMVYSFACALHPNHYKIAYAERTIEVGVLMKAKTWAVSLHVL